MNSSCRLAKKIKLHGHSRQIKLDIGKKELRLSKMSAISRENEMENSMLYKKLIWKLVFFLTNIIALYILE